jgi:prephenate dehydratase
VIAASTTVASEPRPMRHVAPDWLEHEKIGARGEELVIATLGPAGTSSEVAAGELVARLRKAFHAHPRVNLHPSFESAAEAVCDGRADLLLVANAYPRVADFYRDDSLCLVGAFILSTPPYGIAAAPDAPIPFVVRVATHPGPAPLVRQLLSPAFFAREVELVPSTSVAASHVATGQAHLALTNETSVRTAGLEFISSTRVIVMLWSLFARADEEETA